jgi:RNA polymerase sigma-70 factor (ECF subfamily)
MSMTTASALHTHATPIAGPPPEASRLPTPAVTARALSDVDHRQRRALLRFLTRRTGSAEEAEDILQDAYARILAVVHPGAIDTLDRYVWRAALNVMTDHSRARQRRALLSETLTVQAERSAPSAEVVADAQERLAMTGAAVNALPPRSAEAFQLRIVQGLPFENVGQAMHISARMAKIYVARTLRILQDGLDGTRAPAVPARPSRARPPVRSQHAAVPSHPARAPTRPAPTPPHAPLSARGTPARCPTQGATLIRPCVPASIPSPTHPSGGLAMHNPDATAILKTLIEGREPGSLEPLPAGSVVHRADVLRAMLAAVAALERVEGRTRRRAALPDNTGRTWTAEESGRLVTAFKAGEAPSAIAERHGRTLRAIEARLQRMGLLAPEDRQTRGGFGAEP